MNANLDDLIVSVVRLGQVIRRHRAEGNLMSVPPPTVYGYMAFLRMTQAMPHLDPLQIAQSTLLGNASGEDRKHVASVFGEVFGLQRSDEEDLQLGAHLF